MQQSSNNSNKESKPEKSVQRFLEKNKVKTQALKKLLKFIEDKNIADDKPSSQNQDRNLK
jgi:hypothetical protein